LIGYEESSHYQNGILWEGETKGSEDQEDEETQIWKMVDENIGFKHGEQ
jgi:hypothetical protein